MGITQVNKTLDESIQDYYTKLQNKQNDLFNTQLFNVQFLGWDSVKRGQTFTIHYPLIYNECFPADRNILEFNKIFPSNAIAI